MEKKKQYTQQIKIKPIYLHIKTSGLVEHHLKPLGIKHDSYLQDTPDFLQTVQRNNSGPNLSPKTLLATFDVIGLFINVIHDEGLKATEN